MNSPNLSMPRKIPTEVQLALNKFVDYFINHIKGKKPRIPKTAITTLDKYFKRNGPENMEYLFSNQYSSTTIMNALLKNKFLTPTQTKEYKKYQRDLRLMQEILHGKLHTISTKSGLRGIREQLANEFKENGLSPDAKRLMAQIKSVVDTNKQMRRNNRELELAKRKAKQSGGILDILAQRHLEGKHRRH